MTLANAVELGGGYKPYSIKKNTYVTRANGEIEKVNVLEEEVKEYSQEMLFLYLLIQTQMNSI